MSDNNTSDWIYLLMTLIVGGIGFIRSQSKKKPVKPNPDSTAETEYDGEWLEEERETGTDPVLIETYSDYYKGGMEAYKTTESDDYYNEKLAALHTASEEKTKKAEEETEETDFDWKKAIIYSEILNRKYF
ncbi:hypothetical protein [uncultured Odoribacter sp.]|uniref:hypothetical protein n=1 Tax=uncultured Odoribacter sp. TaxID=876416 RepID=UPI00262D25AE|nr:hypothetical protein [uncultured Odoribacter sp.]